MRIRKKILELLKKVNREVNVAFNIPKAISICKGRTYYPEEKRKKALKIITENLGWLVKYKEVNRFYYAYGMDVMGSQTGDYMDYLSFMTMRDALNKPREADSQAAILRDKYLFYKYMTSCHIPTPEVVAVIWNGILYDKDMQKASLDFLPKDENYFVKSVSGECASFVKKYNYKELSEKIDDLKSGGYIVQKECVQCNEMCVLNSTALNTLRIITVNTKGTISIFSALLRVGTKKTGCVDNWAAGGLAVGIDSMGRLKNFGYSKPNDTGGGHRCASHPDSHIAFDSFTLPWYEEAQKLALTAHRYLPGIHSIGWDIALTEQGPIIIEGNDNWEISLMQMCDRPLRSEWEKTVYDAIC